MVSGNFQNTGVFFGKKQIQSQYFLQKFIICARVVRELELLENSNQFHNILIHFDVLPNFSFLLQVKQFPIMTYKHGIYELSHEFPNEIKKLRSIRKMSKLHRMIV